MNDSHKPASRSRLIFNHHEYACRVLISGSTGHLNDWYASVIDEEERLFFENEEDGDSEAWVSCSKTLECGSSITHIYFETEDGFPEYGIAKTIREHQDLFGLLVASAGPTKGYIIGVIANGSVDYRAVSPSEKLHYLIGGLAGPTLDNAIDKAFSLTFATRVLDDLSSLGDDIWSLLLDRCPSVARRIKVLQSSKAIVAGMMNQASKAEIRQIIFEDMIPVHYESAFFHGPVGFRLLVLISRYDELDIIFLDADINRILEESSDGELTDWLTKATMVGELKVAFADDPIGIAKQHISSFRDRYLD